MSDDPLIGSLLAQTYRLQERLGQGGMGVVYRARDERLGRDVALKLLTRASTQDTKARERFAREAKLLAALGHPNVVRLFDVGEADGTPFFAMQLLPGPSLDEWIANQAPDEATWRAALAQPPSEMRQRVRWIALAARAVDEAHEAGAVHRDLKPANLMLDEHGQINVLDFGVAHIMGEDQTATRAQLGTPRFMAPEQLTNPKGVDRRADVYALGLTLYALLSLGKPYPDLEDDHAILLRVGRGDILPIARRNKNVPVDLATIVGKAIETRPQDRYPTAAAFADDLERWLEDRPIAARPAGVFERLAKFARREPGKARAVAILILATVGSLGLALHARTQALDAMESKRKAKVALDLALEQAKRANAEAESARRAEARAMKAVERAERDRERALAAGERAQANMRTARRVLGEQAAATGRARQAAALLAAALPDEGLPAIHGRLVRTLGKVWSAETPVRTEGTLWAANAGGDRVAIGGGGGVSVYDGSGQRLARLDVPGVHVLAYQPGASSPKLACAAWERERSLSLWSAEGEQLASLEGHTGLIKALAWSPDGAWLASGGDRTVRLWQVDGSRVEAGPVLECSGQVRALSFEPRGNRLAVAAGDEVALWDARGQRRRALGAHAKTVRALAWSSDALFSGGDDRLVVRWDLSDLDDALQGPISRAELWGHRGAVTQLASGALLASGSVDGSVRLWSHARGEPQGALEGGDAVLGLAWQGERLASLHARELRVWRAGSGKEATRLAAGDAGPWQTMTWDSQGALWVGGVDALVHWRPARTQREAQPHTSGVWQLSWCAKSDLLVSATLDGDVRLLDPQGRVLGRLERGQPLRSIQPSADGGQALLTGSDGATELWDLRAGRRLRGLGAIAAAAWKPQGTGFATADGRAVRVWAAHDTQRAVSELPFAVEALAWDEAGVLYCAGSGGVWAWAVGEGKPAKASPAPLRSLRVGPRKELVGLDAKGQLLLSARSEESEPRILQASPPGARLAASPRRLAVSGPRGVSVFDWKGVTAGWPIPPEPVRWADWGPRPDELALLLEGRLEVWRDAQRRVVLAQDVADEFSVAGWSPSGRWLATGGSRGITWWSSELLGATPEALRAETRRRTGLRVDGLEVVENR